MIESTENNMRKSAHRTRTLRYGDQEIHKQLKTNERKSNTIQTTSQGENLIYSAKVFNQQFKEKNESTTSQKSVYKNETVCINSTHRNRTNPCWIDLSARPPGAENKNRKVCSKDLKVNSEKRDVNISKQNYDFKKEHCHDEHKGTFSNKLNKICDDSKDNMTEFANILLRIIRDQQTNNIDGMVPNCTLNTSFVKTDDFMTEEKRFQSQNFSCYNDPQSMKSTYSRFKEILSAVGSNTPFKEQLTRIIRELDLIRPNMVSSAAKENLILLLKHLHNEECMPAPKNLNKIYVERKSRHLIAEQNRREVINLAIYTLGSLLPIQKAKSKKDILFESILHTLQLMCDKVELQNKLLKR